VRAFADAGGFPQGDTIGVFGNVAFCAIQELVLDENYRVVVINGGQQQTFGVVGVAGHDDLQTGDVHEPVFVTAAVLRRVPGTRSPRQPHHHGNAGLPAEHVTRFGRLQNKLLHTQRDEVAELHIANGTHPRQCRAHTRTSDSGLRNGRINHPMRAKFLR